MQVSGKVLALVAVVALTVGPATAFAKVGPKQAAKLGTELTSVGANPAGNEAGTIPKWQGKKAFTKEELSRTYDDMLRLWKSNPDKTLLTNKGKDGKIRFTITADNYKQYADKLSAGSKRLFQLYPDTFKMHVYPSVRNAFFPEKIDKWTKYNATHATLTGVDGLEGAKYGFPFPIPANGAQAIWNHKLKFRGHAVKRYNNQAVVSSNGSYEITKLIEDVFFQYANLQLKDPDEHMIFEYMQRTISPPRLAGQVTLVHENFGLESGRNAWLYNPGLDRTVRAPKVGFDTPSNGSDGLQFDDQIDMFNGSLSRYTWKLLGKREMIIPYNSYKMADPRVRYDDLIGKHHINPKYPRYELHRVWVVEADKRPDQRQQIAKRVFYIDEDSWDIVMVDCYDGEGDLWRFQVGHAVTVPFVPTVTTIPEVVYDLKSGRYFVTAMINEDKPNDIDVHYKKSFFAPRNLSRIGRKY